MSLTEYKLKRLQQKTEKDGEQLFVVVKHSEFPYEDKRKKLQKWINFFCFNSGENINDNKK